MGAHPAIPQAASIQDVAPPDELIGLSRLGAEYPDASPDRADTIIRMAAHAAALAALGGFLVYCCMS